MGVGQIVGVAVDIDGVLEAAGVAVEETNAGVGVTDGVGTEIAGAFRITDGVLPPLGFGIVGEYGEEGNVVVFEQ